VTGPRFQKGKEEQKLLDLTESHATMACYTPIFDPGATKLTILTLTRKEWIVEAAIRPSEEPAVLEWDRRRVTLGIILHDPAEVSRDVPINTKPLEVLTRFFCGRNLIGTPLDGFV